MQIVAAFAHPDDETILVGGTLAMLAASGAAIHLLCATRGEGGELGEPPRGEREELGNLRSAELDCAARTLGLASLTFLGYQDPPLDAEKNGQAFAASPAQIASQLRQQMILRQAEVLISHGSNGEYGHPAHRLMHQAAREAVRDSASARLYTISAAFADHPRPRLANADDPADWVVDIQPWFETKLNAASCHATQGALFVRRASAQTGRPVGLAEVLMRLESLHRVPPEGQRAGPDPLRGFLDRHCAASLLQKPAD